MKPQYLLVTLSAISMATGCGGKTNDAANGSGAGGASSGIVGGSGSSGSSVAGTGSSAVGTSNTAGSDGTIGGNGSGGFLGVDGGAMAATGGSTIVCTRATCADLGKNCGVISDCCGGFIDCGTCPSTQCCGCGNPGVGNVCASIAPSGAVPPICIAGSKGCFCDTTGHCAPGLTCDTTQSPRVCCNGADCAPPPMTNNVATCPGTVLHRCTPGITIPTASGTNDSCGYLVSSFVENAFLCGVSATGGGSTPAQIQAYINDEHAMTLGCATASNPVSDLPSNPGYVYYPQTGDPTCTDSSGRPMRPSLFVTDITYDANCTAGDQQQGGQAYDPVAIFGTWKSATGNTPDADPPGGFNYWYLTSNADPIPPSVNAQCPCITTTDGVTTCPASGPAEKGYGTEVRYETALVSGHSYRLQIMVHDGDATQDGEAAEACVYFCAGTGLCVPLNCADYPAGTCGPQPDGCAGLTANCGDCNACAH